MLVSNPDKRSIVQGTDERPTFRGQDLLAQITNMSNYPPGVTDDDPHFTDESEDDDDEDVVITIPCSKCGEPTMFDPTYGDLCYRHIGADNE